MSLIVPTKPVENAEDSPLKHLKVIQAIERLGGSSAYLKHIAEIDTDVRPAWAARKPASLALSAGVTANTAVCAIEFKSLLVFTKATVATVDGEHYSNLEAWGIGLGEGATVGVLTFTSWEEMKDGELDFVIMSFGEGPGGLSITFFRGGNVVGTIVAGGIVEGAGIFKGTCHWS
ncbi:hypothetical protein FRC09_009664 [Ceratobasidium sp. 395]|nr:hypothetical protein FRC09_009664 [Ceratobasidium sp. 395]